MNALTPYELSLLIHFYTTPIRFEHDETEVYFDTCQLFLKLGVIEAIPINQPRDDQESGVVTTKLGDAWIKSILKTPIPTAAFIDADGNII